jgi:hypothetical protein
MKRKLSRLYYIIPIVYVAVIGLFVFLQFRSGERFEERVGTVALSGTYARALTGGRRLNAIEVRIADLRLLINGGSPILAGFGEVRDKKIEPVSYTVSSDGFEIECGDGLLLRFELGEPAGRTLTLRPVIPNDLGTLRTLSVPFRLDEAHRIEAVPGIPLFELVGGVGRWYVSLPEGSTVDAARQRLVIRVAAAEEPISVAFDRLEHAEEPYVYWFSREAPLADESRYRQDLKGFLDRAYRSWSRVAAEQPANPALAGRLGVSLLSESLERGEYRTYLALVSRSIRQILRDNPQAEIEYAGACYLGDLPSFLRRRQAQSTEEISLLTELIRRADLSLFAIPELVPFIVNHAPFSLAEEVVRLADSVDLQKEALIDVLNITSTYLDAFPILGLGDNTLKRIAGAVESRILPAIRPGSGGLYFVLARQGDSASVDLYAAVRAGRVLREAGRLLQEPSYEQLGRNLVLTVLRQADAQAAVPATGSLVGGAFTPDRERLAPEELYRLVAEERYTPEEYPLYRALSPGSWVLTASRLESVQIDPQRQRYLFSFPQGQTHYLLIHGIRPPESVLMHGILWKTDPEYFQYSDGWAYDPQAQSLLVKLTHRVETEEILLNY